ncbi:mitogen-activated protein kinase kinase 9-like [Macadamia integrifolia]|uniref:mitogen-activated protein kinase kinase 9-like n=1 Tax=Macadamia integrifolia TaxID=60698 RepID=UPI001C4FB806|nr:mitogen-activated protein kinase kinase 9-like [Macadamia integrifolia]
MALVRGRRNLNLRLPLRDSTDYRTFFPFPLPLTSYSYATINAGAAPSTQEVDRLSDLEKLKVLGHGNGGTVYEVRHKHTSAIYALKVVRADCDTTVRRQIFREIQILRRTDSPYTVRCHGIFEKPSGDIAIVMEYMDAGTLETLLKSHGTLSEPSLSTIARQVLNGLHYLHSQKIVHRDIKPANLLVNQKMEVKIADFGVSRIMCRMLEPCDSYVGTCAYMSPERFNPDSYGSNYDGYAADIWSLGLTLMELYLGHFPFLRPEQRPDWATLMCAICFGEPPSLPENASDEFRSFINCCLQKDSTKRWTVSQLLSHPFVAKDQEFEN